MQSSFNEKLPVEIICTILSHLPSIEVAKNSRVCKHWSTIIRDKRNRDLWKDASYLGKDIQTSFEITNKRLKILRERSGGTLNHLNIQTDTSADFKAQISIMNEISTMKLSSLRLVLKNGKKWKFEHSVISDSGVNNNFTSMRLAIQMAIANSTNLKSLVIEDHGNFLDPEDMKAFEWELHPFSRCKLDTFVFIGNDFEVLHKDMLLHILSQARKVKIEPRRNISESILIRLMDIAKDTLEECHFKVRADRSLFCITRQVNLPKLIKFGLHINKEIRVIYDGCRICHAFENVSFHWPEIKEIALEGRAKLEFCERLLPPSLESLRFGNINGHLSLKEIISLVAKQKSLKKLALENIKESTSSLLYQMLLKLPHIPLEELEITKTHGLHGEKLIDFIEHRRDNPHSTSITRLYVSLPPKMPQFSKAIKWLEENVENFDYDRSSNK